jgi:sortase B
MIKKHTRKILIIILLGISLGLLGYYVYDKTTTKTIPKVDNLIKEKKKINYKDKDNNKIDVKEYVNKLNDYRSQYGNSNIMGKLDIPNLGIESLIVRTSNNEYYLNYNLYNQYDGLGAPFFDYRNTDLANNRQINIYGHNTRNEKYFDQLPFINLEAYTDKNIFDNYKDIYLSIDEKQIHYEVIAIKIITNQDNEHMKVIFYSDEDYLNHVTKLLKNTLYKENNMTISKDDKLIVLQVCHYNPEGTYLLVIGKEKK